MNPFDDPIATIPQMMEALVAEDPQALALIDASTGNAVTRAEFAAHTRSWANAFAGLGVLPGDHVATLLGPRFDAYYNWLGLCAIQAVEVPLNPELKGRTLTYLVNLSRAATLVTQRDFLEQLANISDTLEYLKTVIVVDIDDAAQLRDLPFATIDRVTFMAGGVTVEPYVAQRHDTACVIATSGTTGAPKGVIVPWGWIPATDDTPERISPGGTRYSFLSPAHMSGKGALCRSVAQKRPLVIREKFSVSAFWDDIRKHDCRTAQLFPSVIKYILDATPASDSDHDVPLEHVWTAPLIPETKEFMDRFGVSVTTGFGSTEIGGPITGPDIDGSNLTSCGRVNYEDPRGYEVRIVDEHDRELPAGQVGELIVRASTPWTLNAGYLDNPVATAEGWRNGWFHTGDALMKDEEGNFYFIDRFKDAIRRKGENISSFEVEGYVTDHPAVAEAAAIGIPSPDGEQEVKVFVRPVDADAGIDLDELGAWVSAHMPRFMVPRYLEIIDEFPKTPATGRIQKSKLREEGSSSHQWDRETAAKS
jgi:crotonobetaine/carnitine-CoA ligase